MKCGCLSEELARTRPWDQCMECRSMIDSDYMAVGPTVWCMLDPIAVTGRHWSTFLSFVAAILNRLANKRRVKNMTIGNVQGGDRSGFQIQRLSSFSEPCSIKLSICFS